MRRHLGSTIKFRTSEKLPKSNFVAAPLNCIKIAKTFNLLAPEFFFLILAHSVYKM